MTVTDNSVGISMCDTTWLTCCCIAPQGDERVVSLAAEVVGPQEPFLDIVQHLPMHSICWPLPLQLEHQHAAANDRCQSLTAAPKLALVLCTKFLSIQPSF